MTPGAGPDAAAASPGAASSAWTLRGKTCLITGANSGLGRESALALARLGAEVILACRNREAGEKTAHGIIEATGNSNVHLQVADLSSQSQIRDLAAAVLDRHPRLHVLMNNAGVLLGRRQTTVEGYETTFAVNHLAYFLLTRLLLDRLRASAPARIINVSSFVHRWVKLRFDDLFSTRRYLPMEVYAASKLANILFTYALARRLKGGRVTVNCLHPGVVATEFGRQGSALYLALKKLARPLFFASPAKGARTQIHLAVSPEVDGITGSYFANNRIAESSAYSHDRKAQERLWDISERLTGLPPWPSPEEG
ncbi:MAG: SDR family oxidoreductase [Nitrospinaceae bacterium]